MTSLSELKSTKRKLSGPRIYLRVLDANDATKRYCDWICNPLVNRFLETKKSTISEQRQYITAKNQKTDTILLGIFHTDKDIMIGTIKLEYINLKKKSADIAIMLGDLSYAGLGLGGEAMRVLINYAFRYFRLTEITLGVIAENTKAVRAYEKLGFKETGRKKDVIHYGLETYDHVAMSLKRGDLTITK